MCADEFSYMCESMVRFLFWEKEKTVYLPELNHFVSSAQNDSVQEDTRSFGMFIRSFLVL